MNGLSETRSNACLPIRREAGLFHSHSIGADGKLLGSKETLLVSRYSTPLIGQRVEQGNFRVGNDSAAGVAHSALKRCSNSRRLSGSDSRAKQQGKRYGHSDGNMAHGNRTASQNHLESPSPINDGRTKKYFLVALQRRPITPQSTDRVTPEGVLGISYRRLLDTQREERGTRCIKKQRSATAWRGKERFLWAGSAHTLCNKSKQRGFKVESRKGIRHSHAQTKNNQGVLRVVPSLHRVIPVIEHLD
jgi:hypothetical protein